MIEIKYVCSNGEEYNLIGDKMKATSGYFHEYEWKPNATEREMGATVNASACCTNSLKTSSINSLSLEIPLWI